jgi:hypothetical protein
MLLLLVRFAFELTARATDGEAYSIRSGLPVNRPANQTAAVLSEPRVASFAPTDCCWGNNQGQRLYACSSVEWVVTPTRFSNN